LGSRPFLFMGITLNCILQIKNKDWSLGLCELMFGGRSTLKEKGNKCRLAQ
jgi:hypothetical protein